MRHPALVASLAVAPVALWAGWTTGYLLDPGLHRTPTYRVPVAVAPPLTSTRAELVTITTETVTAPAPPPVVVREVAPPAPAVAATTTAPPPATTAPASTTTETPPPTATAGSTAPLPEGEPDE